MLVYTINFVKYCTNNTNIDPSNSDKNIETIIESNIFKNPN
jgi:hypothetical protein